MAGHVTFHEEVAPPQAATHSGFQRALHHGRQVIYTLSTIALLLASAIMTYGVIVRHVAGIALIWQDEVCVFLLVGATFLSAASVQAHRGHVGIEAVASLLSPRHEPGASARLRSAVVPVLRLLHVEGRRTAA